MKVSLLRLFVSIFACLSCSGHAQSIVTDPLLPIGYFGFRVTVTAPIQGTATLIGLPIETTGDRINIYWNAKCGSSCPPPTIQTRTFFLQPMAPGTYTLTVHQWEPDRPSPVAQTTVTVSATNPAEFAFEPNPVPAFLPFSVGVTALMPFLNFITPEVEVHDGAIVVYLNGDCGWPECPNPSRATKRFTLPALLPGTYDLVVHPWGRASRLLALPMTGKLTVPAGDNYQGLWWRSPAGTESGWGVQVAHQGQTMFATWFTYDTDGSPMWLVMPSGGRRGPGIYSSALYRVRSLPSGADVNLLASSQTDLVGGATFTFSDRDNGVFSYQVGDVTQSKPITRQVFASPTPTCVGGAGAPASNNFQDLWWNAPAGSEPGWGVQIAHQGDTLFATVFAYDASGNGTWLVMSDGRRTAPGTYSGVLYRTRGPAFSADPWRSDAVSVAAAGRGTFTFTSAQSGTFSYTLDSAPAVETRKSITRQVFDAFVTACN